MARALLVALALAVLSLAAPAAALADGGIAGQVTDATGNPAGGAFVSAIPEGESEAVADTTTADDGSYILSGLPAGDYVVQFDGPAGSDLVTEYFDDQPDFFAADLVTVVDGETAAGIDAALALGGAISGTVTDADGEPIADAVVAAIPPGAGDIVETTTDADGTYRINGLAGGDYAVEFSGPPGSFYVSEFWEDQRSFEDADPVAVGVGATTDGIDASLATGGRISGTVTDAGGEPIDGALVAAIPQAGGEVVETFTEADGTYTLDGLAPGAHTVEFSGGGANYATEYYDDAALFEDADPVTVTAGATTPGIDASLVEGGQITGKVTDADGDPLEDVLVDAIPKGDGTIEAAVTDAAGEYSIIGLATGDYTLRFSAPPGSDLATEFYDDKPSIDAADPVRVTAGETTAGIDAGLAAGAAISGTVTDGEGDPVAGAVVAAYAPGDFDPAVATTGTDGQYTIRGLAGGNYTVRFDGPFGGDLVTEFFDDKPSFDAADPVTAVPGETTANVDAALATGAAIAGTVRDGAGQALPEARVTVSPADGGESFFATTDEDGRYEVAGLPAGDYKVGFEGPAGSDAVAEFFDDKPTRASADAVTALAGETTGGIDATLAQGGSISGRVTAADGSAIEGAQVSATAAEGGRALASVPTAADGTYTIPGLAGGSYKVSFRGPPGGDFVREFFDDKPTLASADAVAVTAGETTDGIDADLAPAGRIAGKVTDAAGSPVQGAAVTVTPASGGPGGGLAATSDDGTYSLTGLAPGAYLVQFEGPFGSDLVPEYFNDSPGAEGAATVTVAAGQTAGGVDASLLPGGRIAGTVTGPGGDPVEGARVIATPAAGGASRTAVSGSGGTYELAVPAGTYTVRFEAADLATEHYADEVAASLADPVTVTVAQRTAGIDAQLEAAGRITGRVTDASGTPLAGAKVTVGDGAGHEVASALTGADGTYAIGALRAGTYRVRFEAAGFDPRVLDAVAVTGGQTTATVDAQLAPASTGGTPGPTGPPSGGGGPGPAAPLPPAPLTPAPALATLTGKARLQLRKGRVKLGVICGAGQGECRGTVRLYFVTRVRGERRRVRIGSARMRIGPARRRVVVISLNAKGRRIVRRQARRDRRTVVTVRVPGSAGQKSTLERVTLRVEGRS